MILIVLMSKYNVKVVKKYLKDQKLNCIKINVNLQKLNVKIVNN